jgi:hypothetical protein
MIRHILSVPAPQIQEVDIVDLTDRRNSETYADLRRLIEYMSATVTSIGHRRSSG